MELEALAIILQPLGVSVRLEPFVFATALTVREPASLTDNDSTRLVRRKSAWICGKNHGFPTNPQERGFGTVSGQRRRVRHRMCRIKMSTFEIAEFQRHNALEKAVREL